MFFKVTFENEIMIKSLSNLPSQGMFLATFQMVEPDDNSTGAKTTGALLILDDNKLFEKSLFTVDNFMDNSQMLLLELSQVFIKAGFIPETILSTDDDTNLVLSDYCSKVGINLYDAFEYAQTLPFMQNVDKYDDDEYAQDWEDYADEYELSDEERIEVIIQALMMFTDEEIQQMEPEFINEAKDLVNLGAFPPELEAEARRKLGMDGDGK